jgi:hypothetical protein
MTRQRECGGCTACCKLLPVYDNEPWYGRAPIQKAAGERCPHQRHNKGCAIYSNRPFCCRVWNCRWLVNEAGDTRRPDHAHYVIDIMPDIVRGVDPNTGQKYHAEAVQVWVDPRHRDAHRDPALRAFLARRAAEHGEVAIIRYNSREAFVLCAPTMSGTGDWAEMNGTVAKRDHFLSHPDTWTEPPLAPPAKTLAKRA